MRRVRSTYAGTPNSPQEPGVDAQLGADPRDRVGSSRNQVSSELVLGRRLRRIRAVSAAFLAAGGHVSRREEPAAGLRPLGPTSMLCESLATLSATDHGELFQLLDAQVGHMTRLVTGLLDLARSEAGVLAVRAESRSVLELLKLVPW